MIEQNVQVLQFSDEHLWVRMGSQNGCTACESGMGCGAGLFAKLLRRETVVLELPRNGIKVETGQMLTLSFPERLYTKLVFASYGWPLLAALAGAFAGYGAGVWLHLSALLIDALTLAGGGLAAFVLLQFINRGRTTETLLESLSMAVCSPSDTPDLCSGLAKKPGHC
ncbi:MAG: SoxR reducing system RseC family protein [Lysobacterales bacterium]